MADVRLNSLTFPDLPDRYVIKDYDADIAQIFEDVYNLYPRKTLPSAPLHAFSDGADGIPVKAMSVDVSAVQDLHGYDAPYPAGGGKNLLPATLSGVKALNTTGTWSGNTYTINGVSFAVSANAEGSITSITVNNTASTAVYFTLYNQQISAVDTTINTYSEQSGSARITLGTNGDSSSTYGAFYRTSDYACQIVVRQGYTASNLVMKPMIYLATEQDTTFAPYSNICPISGWSEAHIVGGGANLFSTTPKTVTNNGVTFVVNADGTVTANGTATSSAAQASVGFTAPPAGNYYFTGCPINSGVAEIICWDSTRGGRAYKWNGSTGSDTCSDMNLHEVSFIDGHTFIMNCRVLAGQTVNNFTFRPMIFASTASLVTIAFGSTVYGGTLTYKGGLEWEFTATHVLIDLSVTGNWVTTSWGGYRSNTSEMDILAGLQDPSDFIASHYKSSVQASVAQATEPSIAIGISSYPRRVYVYTGDADTPPTGTLCAKLDTPLAPITLTADAECVTQYGDNTMWVDCGDSELTYRQDIGLLLAE